MRERTSITETHFSSFRKTKWKSVVFIMPMNKILKIHIIIFQVSYDNEEFDVVEYKTSDARESGKENIAYVKEQEFGTSPPPYDDDNVNSTRF